MTKPTPILARQPIKSLYILLFVLTAFIRFPFYIAKYALPSNRPNPNWPYRAAVLNQISKIGLNFLSKIRVVTKRSLEPGKDKENFALVNSASDTLFKGFLASKSSLKAQIGGIWIPNSYNASTKDSSRVLLHFHGGAYVLMTPRDSASQYGPRMLCEELPAAAAFCPDYRLASNPNGAFPAQLQDALASYHWLIHDKDVKPSHIIFSGDSAGGHLVLTLLRYLTEHPDTMPLPQAALLHSPWLNLTKAGTDVDGAPYAASDFLSTTLLQWGTDSFVPKDTPLDSEYISPLYHPFAVDVPIWVQAGTAEVFYPNILEWVEKMKAVKGNTIELHEAKDAMHDIFTAGGEMGMSDKAREGARKAKEFLDKHGRA